MTDGQMKIHTICRNIDYLATAMTIEKKVFVCILVLALVYLCKKYGLKEILRNTQIDTI